MSRTPQHVPAIQRIFVEKIWRISNASSWTGITNTLMPMSSSNSEILFRILNLSEVRKVSLHNEICRI